MSGHPPFAATLLCADHWSNPKWYATVQEYVVSKLLSYLPQEMAVFKIFNYTKAQMNAYWHPREWFSLLQRTMRRASECTAGALRWAL